MCLFAITLFAVETLTADRYVTLLSSILDDLRNYCRTNKPRLRHSYATHLLECGTDMVFIQKLLGHKDIKTAEIYAKVSNCQLSSIKSPLDDM